MQIGYIVQATQDGAVVIISCLSTISPVFFLFNFLREKYRSISLRYIKIGYVIKKK